MLLYDEMATLEPSAANLAADLLDLALLTNNFGTARSRRGTTLRGQQLAGRA